MKFILIIKNVDDDYKYSTTYRNLIRNNLKYEGQFEIKLISREQSFDLKLILEELESEYFCVLESSYSVRNDFIPTVLTYLEKHTVYLCETYKFYKEIPSNLNQGKLNKRSLYNKDTNYFGVIFKSKEFLIMLGSNSEMDESTYFINFKLFYTINISTYLQTVIATHSNTHLVNGIDDIKQVQSLLFYDNELAKDELRLNILKYLILAIKKIKNAGMSNHSIKEFIGSFNKFNLFELREYININDRLEFDILVGIANMEYEAHTALYKELGELKVCLVISKKVIENSGTLLYKLKFIDGNVYIYRKYHKKNIRCNVDEIGDIDFYASKINTNSIFLFMDRTSVAGDNGESLYEFFIKNYPHYEHAYFILAKSSPDWARLTLKGFKLISYGTIDFYEKFYEAEVFISSQIYNFSYKKKDFTNSRMVYLQHGVILTDMRDWILSKYCDLFITTGEKEYKYVSNLLPQETINTGLPRMQFLEHESEKDIIFMPTWRFSLNTTDDNHFIQSEYFKNMNSLLNNKKLIKYLQKGNKKLKVKLHPNLVSRKNLFKFSETIEFSEESYSDLYKYAQFVFTDYSSAVIDAAFLGIPIGYYQIDASKFFLDQPFNQRIDYVKDGVGATFFNESEMVEYIVQEMYRFDREIYDPRSQDLFRGVDKENINHKIVERILEL